MTRRSTDFFIAGAGPAGLIAAAALRAQGARVLLADPAPAPQGNGDRRSTALLRPTRALLEGLGLWDALAPHATPLEALCIVDLAGAPPALRSERRFDGDGTPLAWNVPAPALQAALLDRLAGEEILWGAGVTGLVNRSTEALLTLANGTRIAAGLAVAADGRASPLREAAGLTVHTTRLGQKALAFSVTHPAPHQNVSSEFYLDGGPFTMVPLPDIDDRPASAVVWMMDGPEALRLAQAPADAFGEAATRRTAGLMGALTLASPRAIWPVITQRAPRLVSGRVVLVAEAAHVVPPIGAQGLNMSVADIACLSGLLASRPADLTAALAAYEAERGRDIALRVAGIDLYNRVTRAPDILSQRLRQLGLAAVHDIAPLRAAVIRAGMGPARAP